ncbi:MAG: hypothetical protein WCE51_06525 [Chthoniobacterales bacterium]
MKTLLLTTLVFVGLTTELIRAQNPTPVIVQAATSAPAAAAAAAPNSAASIGLDNRVMLQLLQEMQATNAATIKKQEATLLTLDALQKAAEELKIFSKRG